MAAPTEEQLARLPKWARKHIDLLAMRLLEASTELGRIRGDKPTRIQVDPDRYRHAGEPNASYYAENDATVRFRTGDDWQDYIDVKLQFHPRRGAAVLIRSGQMGLDIAPESGNVCNIRPRRS